MERTAKRGAQHFANIVVVALSSKSGNQIPSGGSNEAIVIRIIHEELGKPPFHREVRHLQVAEIVVKNISMMGCDQGATTPSYWAGRLA